MKIEANFFNLKPKNAIGNGFSSTPLNSENEGASNNVENVNKLQEIIEGYDDYSCVDANDFDLKMEDCNFVWDNRDKLRNIGYTDKQIKESVQQNDVAKDVTEFWSEQEESAPNAEQVVYSNKSANKIKDMSTSELKDYAKKHDKSKNVLDEQGLDSFAAEHGLKLSEKEKSQFMENQKEEQEEKTQAAYGKVQTIGGYTFNAKEASACAETCGIAARNFKSAASEAQHDDEKYCSNIDKKHAEIKETIAKTESIKNKAKQKMQKSIAKSQALTAKSNNACAKVGLKSINALQLKTKQSSNSVQTEAKNENTKTDNSAAKTEATAKENVQPTVQPQVSVPAASVEPKENAAQKATEQNAKAENAKQADEQKTQENQKGQKNKNVQKQAGQVKQNDEAIRVAKEAQSQTISSMNVTKTTFNKIEQTGETIVEQSEQQVDIIETYETKREKDSSKIKKGRIEEGIAASMIGADIIAFGVAAYLQKNPTSRKAGVKCAALAIPVAGIAIALYLDGKDNVKDGKKGHEETYLASTQVQTHAQEVQQSANEMNQTAQEDVKQSEKIDKENAQKERQIDDILRKQQQEEQQQAA